MIIGSCILIITLCVNGLNALTKRHRLAGWMKNVYVCTFAESWLILKDPDAGKDWGQEEKGMTEEEMAGWHHRLMEMGLGWTLGVGDGQGGLACRGSLGHKESDTTEQLNWTEYTSTYHVTLLNPSNCFYIVRLIMFPLWLEIVIIFYFLSDYWLLKLINMFYCCYSVQ